MNPKHVPYSILIWTIYSYTTIYNFLGHFKTQWKNVLFCTDKPVICEYTYFIWNLFVHLFLQKDWTICNKTFAYKILFAHISMYRAPYNSYSVKYFSIRINMIQMNSLFITLQNSILLLTVHFIVSFAIQYTVLNRLKLHLGLKCVIYHYFL